MLCIHQSTLEIVVWKARESEDRESILSRVVISMSLAGLHCVEAPITDH